MTSLETLTKFDKYYYDTYREVSKYVVCNCSNIEDVKDIIQNIYLELYKQLQKKKVVDHELSYVMGIAKHKVKDYYRFQYKRKIRFCFFSKEACEWMDTIPTKVNIEKELLTKEDINRIWKHLKKKNVIISKIFYLYYYTDNTIKEISNTLEITESNVKNYLYRTLKELNILLKKEDD